MRSSGRLGFARAKTHEQPAPIGAPFQCFSRRKVARPGPRRLGAAWLTSTVAWKIWPLHGLLGAGASSGRPAAGKVFRQTFHAFRASENCSEGICRNERGRSVTRPAVVVVYPQVAQP